MPKWQVHADQIRELVKRHPDLTLEEIRTKLGTTLCVQTMSNALHSLKLSLKKVIHAAEQDRPDVATAEILVPVRQRSTLD